MNNAKTRKNRFNKKLPEKPCHIVLVGSTNSGKTTAGQILGSLLNWEVIEASSFLKQLTNERHGADTELLPDVIRNIVESTDRVGVARRVLEYLDKNDISKSVIVGFRTPEEVELIKENLEKVEVYEVHSPYQLRIRRAVEEQPTYDTQARKHFHIKDNLDVELGINDLLQQGPKEQIVNDGDIKNLSRRLEDITCNLDIDPRLKAPQYNQSITSS